MVFRGGKVERGEELGREGLEPCSMQGTKLGREDHSPYSSASSPPHPAPSPPNSLSSASPAQDETAT